MIYIIRLLCIYKICSMLENLLVNLIAFLIFFSVMMFIFFDGIDLGIGIIFPFLKTKENKSIAISSIHPFWDVNETWIILAAVFLILGFTQAYGIFILTFYIPVILLLGLIILRGASFEFRSKNDFHSKFWDWTFFLSSFLMTLIFGVFIGNLVAGLNVDENMIYRGSFFDLFNLISISSGVMTVSGIALIGANWLGFKTTEELHNVSLKISKRITRIIFISSIHLIIFTLTKDSLKDFIFNNHRICIISSLILIGYSILILVNYFNKKNKNFLAFIASLAFALNGGILLLSLTYPYIVPRKFTIYELSRFKMNIIGSQNISVFILLFLILVLFYFFKNYRIFRGKIQKEIHY